MRIVSLVAAFALMSGSVLADDPSSSPGATDSSAADASVSLSGTSIAAGIGWVWGKGEIDFKGKEHTFKISGLSVVDAGVASISASGGVYNLKNLSDFNGNYTAASAGITVAGGAGATFLQNEHGVVIKLIETTQGLRLNLAAQGVKISLKT